MTAEWQAGEIAVPVTIVHGDEDPVVPLSAGRRLHALIPGSRLEVVGGMGHQQPAELDEFFVDVVDAVARRA